jgi:hypothetical protein
MNVQCDWEIEVYRARSQGGAVSTVINRPKMSQRSKAEVLAVWWISASAFLQSGTGQCDVSSRRRITHTQSRTRPCRIIYRSNIFPHR